VRVSAICGTKPAIEISWRRTVARRKSTPISGTNFMKPRPAKATGGDAVDGVAGRISGDKPVPAGDLVLGEEGR